MNDYDNIIDTFIEIKPMNNDSFLKIKETLTRIGIASRKDANEFPTLWQSCHILHKKGRYYIVHFKQLFLLDGRSKKTEISQEDFDRTALIANMLSQWGLVEIISKLKSYDPSVRVVVIPFKEKSKWILSSKYNIGKKQDAYYKAPKNYEN